MEQLRKRRLIIQKLKAAVVVLKETQESKQGSYYVHN